jgi:regulator of protease activity HflC (stomatin/prohibitin superfamily)
MYNGLNTDLAELFISIEPHKFLFKKVAFPDDVDQVFLNTAVQELENEKAILEQAVALTTRETARLIEEIDANITVVTATAMAEAEAIVNIAEAEAERIIQEATGVGINYMFTALNITQPEEREKLFELFGILDNENGVQILSGNINPLVNV